MAYKRLSERFSERMAEQHADQPKVETRHVETSREHDINNRMREEQAKKERDEDRKQSTVERTLHMLQASQQHREPERDASHSRAQVAEMVRNTSTESSKPDHSAARDIAMRMLSEQKRAKDAPVRRTNMGRYMKQLSSAPRNFRYPST